MNRDFKITSRSFKIPLTSAEYDSIDHCERTEFVWQLLQEIPGVYDVDYNGHFGEYIFLTIEKEFDNDKTLRAISEVINREGNLTHYEIWGNDSSWTMAVSETVQDRKDDGWIESDAKLIYDFYAFDYEEAKAIYTKTLKEMKE